MRTRPYRYGIASYQTMEVFVGTREDRSIMDNRARNDRLPVAKKPALKCIRVFIPFMTGQAPNKCCDRHKYERNAW